MYGAGSSLSALYQRPAEAVNKTCYIDDYHPEFCLVSTRNVPYEGWSPAFVVFPLTSDHVVSAVKFAVKHNICIMIAGPGHDFVNRHSCNNGLFIRTILMKSHSFDMTDSKGLGAPDGSVTFGPGIVFSEAHNITSSVGRYIASGWGITVGIVGWSLGGGHGPFTRSAGLGVDNMLAADVVLANGTIVTASSTSNPDLFWALRGGGGSTWGVITSLTIRMHVPPAVGLTKLEAGTTGLMCGPGEQFLEEAIDRYISWSLTLSDKWSGLAWFSPNGTAVSNCSGSWGILTQYVYLGASTDPEFVNVTNMMKSAGLEMIVSPYKTVWDYAEDYPLGYITPVNDMAPSEYSVGGVASVLVNESTVKTGAVAARIKDNLALCPTYKLCSRQQIYHDLFPQPGPDPATSISDGFRSATYHLVVAPQPASQMEEYYQLGPNSYQNEAAYTFAGEQDPWKPRLFGDRYDRLLSIKRAIDPNNVFWCYHCVGSDLW